eukprot:5925361-Pyramimonas_sp.AAC.1
MHSRALAHKKPAQCSPEKWQLEARCLVLFLQWTRYFGPLLPRESRSASTVKFGRATTMGNGMTRAA